MNINKQVAARTAGAGLVAALAMAAPFTSGVQIGAAQAAPAAHHATAMHDGMRAAPMDHHLMVGPSGNKVEMLAPFQSRYVPRILKAPVRQRARARRLLRSVNEFCRTQSLAEIKANWRPGNDNPTHPTHYFNPRAERASLNPAHARSALVYDGKLNGVMFTGKPLPYLGPIPRAHVHEHMSMGAQSGVEMVHVYCTDDLTVKSMREAYTPNRQLGVLADTKRLRLRIRPAVMDLNPRQLREVRAKVRGYVGKRPPRVRTGSGHGPDPRLQAMRTEIRSALMLMNESQLRSVWRLMRSY